MPLILTTADTIVCPHMGTVTLASSQSKVSAGGAPVLRPGDTFTVTGCVFNISSSAHPCVTVEWEQPARLCSAASDNVLTTASVGVCKAADQAVQGVALIQQTQKHASAK